jgi:hypothetical protein
LTTGSSAGFAGAILGVSGALGAPDDDRIRRLCRRQTGVSGALGAPDGDRIRRLCRRHVGVSGAPGANRHRPIRRLCRRKFPAHFQSNRVLREVSEGPSTPLRERSSGEPGAGASAGGATPRDATARTRSHGAERSHT